MREHHLKLLAVCLGWKAVLLRPGTTLSGRLPCSSEKIREKGKTKTQKKTEITKPKKTKKTEKPKNMVLCVLCFCVL